MASGTETWGFTSTMPNSVTLYWPLVSLTWTALMNFEPTSMPTRFREAMIQKVYHPLRGCQGNRGMEALGGLFHDAGGQAERDRGLGRVVLQLLLGVAG